jgi:hypothetical protein
MKKDTFSTSFIVFGGTILDSDSTSGAVLPVFVTDAPGPYEK